MNGYMTERSLSGFGAGRKLSVEAEGREVLELTLAAHTQTAHQIVFSCGL